MRRVAWALLAALPVATVARAQPCPVVRALHFAPAAAAMTLQGGIARGERACYSLDARLGQSVRVSVASQEANAVLQFYRPGWTIRPTDGGADITGRAYPGAAEGDDARRWTGRLTATGAQLLVIGSVRGGAAFRVTVRIAP